MLLYNLTFPQKQRTFYKAMHDTVRKYAKIEYDSTEERNFTFSFRERLLCVPRVTLSCIIKRTRLEKIHAILY